MSQVFTDDCFAGGHAGQTDLQNMENNFAALKSCFSGTTQPANTVAGMLWFDTTQLVMKQRDSANGAWLGLMHGDTSQKVWVYRNSDMDGWDVDSGVSDKVLAIKGGTTYTAGAATSGNWTLGGFTADAHNHKWYDYRSGQNAQIYDTNGDADPLDSAEGNFNTESYGGVHASDVNEQKLSIDAYTNDATPIISHDGTSRPAAAVGTLQYLDL